MRNKITKIQKREGNIVPFNSDKITIAILKAGQVLKEFDKTQAEMLSDKAVEMLNTLYGTRKSPPRVEEIQDVVEIILMKNGFVKSAKAYIIYRGEHKKIREAKQELLSGKTTKLPLSINAIRVIANRYLVKNLKTQKVLETPEGMFERIAKALADVEKKYKVSAQKVLVSEFQNSDTKGKGSGKRSFPVGVTGANEVSDARGRKPYGEHGSRTSASDHVRQLQKQFYEVMANFEFMPAGRTLANAGTDHPIVSNCIVLHIDDSMDGIFQTLHDAALLQQAGSGLGFPFHMLRPAGSIGKRTQSVASGPVSFLKVYNRAFGVIKQQMRSGANMSVMRIDHPDVLDFVHCKEKEGEIVNFNISVAVTDTFMRAVKENSKQPWMCEFKGKKMLPRRVKKDRNGIVQEIKQEKMTAREIMDEIVKAAWSNGEPGIIFIDEVNRTNPLPGLGRLEASNPCVTGDTWVTTSSGPKKVSDLIDKSFTAIVNGKERPAPHGFFRTGIKPVYRLKTKQGFELRLTKDHRVRKKGRSLEWVEAEKLKPGDKIMLHNHSDFSWKGKHTEGEGYVMGLLLGDGTINLAKGGADMILSSWGDTPGPIAVRDYVYNRGISKMSEINKFQAFSRKSEISYAPRERSDQGACPNFANNLPHRSDFKGWFHIPDRNEYRLSLVSLDTIAHKLKITTKKYITEEMEMASSDFYKGFLRGLFDSDGSVQGTQMKGVSVRLTQNNTELLKVAQRMLLRLGIVSKIYSNRRPAGTQTLPDGKGGSKNYPVKALHELVISCQNLHTFYQRVGFADVEKMEKLKNALDNYKRNLNQEDFSVTVQEISFDGVEEVYDVQVPSVNAFDANGLYVHNCSEQFLHAGDVCNLGSINLDKFVKHKKINWQRLGQVTENATRMLDNVIDITDFPVDRVNKVFRKNRRIGLGIMGFADMLYQLHIPYNSEQGREVAEKVMKFINDKAHKTSTQLAKEKGVFPNYNKSVFSKYGIKMRNAALTTVAPTGSISMVVDACSGLEPCFALAYVKEVMSGQKLYYTNRHLETALRECGLYSEKLVQEIAQCGNIQSFKQIPASLKKVFVGSLDISVTDHIKMQAAFQKYVDNSISKTINFPNDAPPSDVLNAYMLAWKLKCKSCTVYREGSRQSEVLTLASKKEHETSSPALDMLEHPSNKCPECGGKLFAQEGCLSCPQCGFGLCSI
ncbi:ATP cone domain-containing protein [Patescibacteria group bacterium AH-259-L07]|nr:ATP cone domain-containing protein [Patescibacteria group bacterium AH-259-L07]